MTVADLCALIARSTVLDLSHQYFVGMPQSPNHPPFRMLLERRHGDMVRADGDSAANELIVLGGHVGTHVDSLAHVSHDGLLHGGVEASSVQSHKGFSQLGIDEFTPHLGRGVLLDVTAVHGVESLPPGYEVTVADLQAAQESAGLQINPGDVILVGTGWSRNWDQKELFTGQVHGVPGPGIEAGKWLAAKEPKAVGAESIAFEHIGASNGHAFLPVHRLMLVEKGINIVETMNLDQLLRSEATEFVIVLNPLSIRGGTGAPVRPIALLP